MKTLRWLDNHLEETLLCILLVCISCVELIQVIARNGSLVEAVTWAEEFCRFCWIWSVFLSLPYTIKAGGMLRVRVLSDMLAPRAEAFLEIIVNVLTALIMGGLGICSIPVVQTIFITGETSPAMLWPMWTVYMVLIIGFLLGFLRGVQKTAEHIIAFRNLKKGGEK